MLLILDAMLVQPIENIFVEKIKTEYRKDCKSYSLKTKFKKNVIFWTFLKYRHKENL